jgi:hypothetical protein
MLFNVPAQHLTDEQLAQMEAFTEAITASRIQKLGVSHHEVITWKDGVEIILATPDKLISEMLLQLDGMMQEAFPDPVYKPGNGVSRYINNIRIPLWAVAHKDGYVLSTAMNQLLTARGEGMGMSDQTRLSVVEYSTVITRPQFQNMGLASAMTEVLLTKGIEAILKMLANANRADIDLEHTNDTRSAPDLSVNTPTIYGNVKGRNAIIRAFFESTKLMARVQKQAETLGFVATDASLALVNRSLGEIVTEQEVGSSEVTIGLTRTFPQDGKSVATRQQLVFFGEDVRNRANAVAEQIAEVAGKRGDAREDDDEYGWVSMRGTNDPTAIVIPALEGRVFDLSSMTDKEAEDKLDEIKAAETGDFIVVMPMITAYTVAWGLHRTQPVQPEEVTE